MRARIVTGLTGIVMTLIVAAAISPMTGAQASSPIVQHIAIVD